jgi:hypothetical protein
MDKVDPKALTGQENRAWISGLRTAFADIKAVVENQQKPLRKRRLGPVEARRITGEAFVSIEKALAYAKSEI